MLRPAPGALLGAALLAACQSRSSAPRAEVGVIADPAETVMPEGSSLSDEAQRRIEEGDFDRARDLLDQLLLEDDLARARELLRSGAPEDALVVVDRALDRAPGDRSVRLLKADASLRLAEAKIRAGGGSLGLIDGALNDALEFYRDTDVSAHALLGASWAAYRLGRSEEGLDYARRGLEALGGERGDLGELGLQPQRIYAEQVYAAYASAKAEAREEAGNLSRECEDALGRLLGRESSDPWAWSRLSDLREGEGALADAKDALLRGLARAPEDLGLLERLARVGRALEGSLATVATFEHLAAAHPEVTANRWYLSVARFQLALDGYKETPLKVDTAPFSRAEQDFRDLRESAPEYAQWALGYELVCRLGRGWCAFHTPDLVGARREFLSMNELAERGVEWSLPGELESGIQGLFYVADAYHAQGADEAAGEVFERLQDLQPDQDKWGNNAGVNLRDAAVNLEREGKHLCSAARGLTTNAEALAELRALAGVRDQTPGSSAEQAAFARAADERFQRARDLMERSWRAYRPAAELVPEDVRVVNDAALVLVYYLHHDLELAERLLLRCVELGGPQIESKRAALAIEESPEKASQLENELALLTEAWGDAHQNLGVLEWVHRRNAGAARPWLEKALAIGPERLPVTNSLLPQVLGELEPDKDDDPWDLLSWAQPCQVH